MSVVAASLTADQVFIEALSLPAHVRSELAERLLASLEGEKIQKEIDQAWSVEVLERCKAFEEGRMTSRPADEVMRELYAKLK